MLGGCYYFFCFRVFNNWKNNYRNTTIEIRKKFYTLVLLQTSNAKTQYLRFIETCPNATFCLFNLVFLIITAFQYYGNENLNAKITNNNNNNMATF